ncbi:hypothetical protein PSTT_04106 [Puccinia striiformis]|uniref:PSP proline-rich domain-containing protein n=1 Tax=Puccinia striiformis TaxID=27350 RepID=A0A2S4VTR8_9BASI|nr:hypothetical protein PSTT_04106 [Puccinia striiformis]
MVLCQAVGNGQEEVRNSVFHLQPHKMASVIVNGNDLNGHPSKTKGLTRGQLKRLKQKQKPKRTTTLKLKRGGLTQQQPNELFPDRPSTYVPTHQDTRGAAGRRNGIEEDDETDDMHSSVSSVVDDTLTGIGEMDDTTRELFADVFAKFQPTDQDAPTIEEENPEDPGKGQVIYSDDEMPSDGDSDAPKPDISKRKQRKMARLTVAELKRLVKKPEVVEWVDVTAQDPKLLVQLKSYIADTGIATQRDAIKEKESEQSLRQKTRERVQPKMGKIDIDYQKLHDAFFKYQVPPVMTTFGEMLSALFHSFVACLQSEKALNLRLYHEGKEFETKLKEKRPGDLSEDLKEALSIPPLAPPPWLIAMQRYGPPPSYPNLKIPGLNAPIPEGAQWGYHPGGWGKPPTDEFGRPLYGDVFGKLPSLITMRRESEEESDGEGAGPSTAEGTQTPTGLETPSGLASITSTVPGGLETPDFIELRKRREGPGAVEPEIDTGPKSLYHVIPEKESKITGFMGSERVYDVRGISQHGHNVSMLGQEDRGTKRKATGGVDVALDPSELEGLSEDQLRQRYEESKQRSNGGGVGNQQGGREDLSDLVAQESAKRKGKTDSSNPSSSKNRDREKEKFKF